MSGVEGRLLVACHGPAQACLLCIAKIKQDLYAHIPIYLVDSRNVVALQVSFDNGAGALLPQLIRESAALNAGRLLLSIFRDQKGSRYSVRRLREMTADETIGDQEINDFVARDGLKGADVRDLYPAFSNAELARRWPEVADLIRVHHPEIDLSKI